MKRLREENEILEVVATIYNYIGLPIVVTKKEEVGICKYFVNHFYTCELSQYRDGVLAMDGLW